MRRTVIALLFTWLASAHAAPPSDAVIGIWLTSAEDGYIQIFESGGHYHGKIVGAPDPEPRKDVHNPDPAERDESLLGKRILNGFTYDDGQWSGGTIYDPDEGKTYDAKMWLEDADTLKLRGFVGISWLGRTETWTRADREAEGVVELDPTVDRIAEETGIA